MSPKPQDMIKESLGSETSQNRSASSLRQRRPKFTVPKKNALKRRDCKMEVNVVRALLASSSSTLSVPSSSAATSVRKKLSPLEKMKNYVARADERIEDVIERIVQNVHTSGSAIVLDASEKATEIVHHAVQRLRDWKACHFEKLPQWMRDNDFLHFGHRPELPSFTECFRSIFRIHTETGNIWTHLIGFVAFIVVTIVFYVKPLCEFCHHDIHVSDKLIFLFFFLAAILCLACSTLFHTVSCHSPDVSSLFSRLDYCGIAILIVGSVIPWLYYGFYCQFYAKLTYMIVVGVLGLATIVVVMWEEFNKPEYRSVRALVFVSLALMSALPAVHYVVLNGFRVAMIQASMHYTLLMGFMYLLGALLYATRIPERFLPGKCDIWFHSHQIFHLLVVGAAFVHYHGISEMAVNTLLHAGNCPPSQPSSSIFS